jgi:hypothetical protein
VFGKAWDKRLAKTNEARTYLRQRDNHRTVTIEVT